MRKIDSYSYLQEAQTKVDIDEIIESFFTYVIDDFKDTDIDYLFSTFHNFMKHLKLYNVLINDNNDYLRRNMYEDDNPLEITRAKIDNWYNKNGEMKREEKICYTMLYANRLSKVANQAIEIYIKSKKECAKADEYIECLRRIYRDVRGKKSFFEFLKEYDRKNMGIISEGEFQQQKCVKKIKKSISRNKIPGYYIDIEDVFRYCVLQEVTEKMYTIKNKGIKMLMEEGCNAKICIDGEKDSRIVMASINIPQYSVPFKFHFYRRYLNELAEQYGISMQTKSMDQFPSIWPMKLTDEQIKRIEGFTRVSEQGKQIQRYIIGNKEETKEIKRYSRRKSAKSYNAKKEKDRQFAIEVAKLSGISLEEQHIAEIEYNSQTTMLRTRYKTMQQYFIDKWNEEGKEFTTEELDQEVAKAFVYVKLVRGGIQSLSKNMSGIYQDYQDGCRYIEEAIQQGESDIKSYTKTKMRKRKINKINGMITEIDQIKQRPRSRSKSKTRTQGKNTGEQK